MSLIFKKLDIAGEKVRLRPVQPGDAREAYRLVTNEAVLSNLAWDGPANEKEVRDTYRRWQGETKTGQSCSLTIEELNHSSLIGCIGVNWPRHPQQVEIGYWLGEPFWNRGYITEAVRLACHLSFRYFDAVRVHSTVFVGNTSSRRVLEKNGFSLDGTLRSHIYKRGEWRDTWIFTLLRTEWEAKYQDFRPEREDIVVVRKDE